ncbi:uncharacterized protein LOC111830608 [Capsella rubella]|uniref:uncharacterized protein LOC111830608 n=1 Tax=Capsella rubella TaxID=81985 RepID=UPI000CD4E050|nr:uncharacterized protein LOC111830608 [Capsella rubella]
MEDPRSFLLPGRIGEHTFDRCLCDLGAGVSLMPISVSKRLGLTNFTPTKMSLILADRSVRFPVGVAEDVHVRVGNFYTPTDFVIIELYEEPRDPLILDRPFLNTVGALIDVRKSKIKLHIDDFVQEFNLERVMSKPTIEGQTLWVDIMDELADELLEELSMDDPLQIAMVKEADQFGYLGEATTRFAKLLDSAPPMSKEVEISELEITKEENVAVDPTAKPCDDWSELKAPKVELKPLPAGLRYAFLGPNSSYPVIINAELN